MHKTQRFAQSTGAAAAAAAAATAIAAASNAAHSRPLLLAGKLVLQKLRERPAEFEAVKGLVRRQEQQQELGPGVVLGDVLQPESWEAELAGCTHLVM